MDSEEETTVLVARAQRGDRTAFETLVSIFRPRLEALVRSRLGAHLRAATTGDDIVQETLLEALRSIGGFRSTGDDAFMRWLGGIAEHLIRREFRRQLRDQRIRLDQRPGEETSPAKAARRRERMDRLRDAVARLSPDHRQVVLLARIEGLRVKEIARRMNRSETAIRNLLLRALRELAKAFGETESFGLPSGERLVDEEGTR